MGLFDRLRRRLRDEPAEPAPGLFTAHTPPPETLRPSGVVGPATTDDLWHRPEPGRGEAATPAGVAHDGGSTAGGPLFGGEETSRAEAEPVPPRRPSVVDPPDVATEPDPYELVAGPDDLDPPRDADGRTMRVHDGRLDRRPGPIRMSPSEAVALAEEGPRALRRRMHPEG